MRGLRARSLVRSEGVGTCSAAVFLFKVPVYSMVGGGLDEGYFVSGFLVLIVSSFTQHFKAYEMLYYLNLSYFLEGLADNSNS